jgi:hypothetical protein
LIDLITVRFLKFLVNQAIKIRRRLKLKKQTCKNEDCLFDGSHFFRRLLRKEMNDSVPPYLIIMQQTFANLSVAATKFATDFGSLEFLSSRRITHSKQRTTTKFESDESVD